MKRENILVDQRADSLEAHLIDVDVDWSRGRRCTRECTFHEDIMFFEGERVRQTLPRKILIDEYKRVDVQQLGVALYESLQEKKKDNSPYRLCKLTSPDGRRQTYSLKKESKDPYRELPENVPASLQNLVRAMVSKKSEEVPTIDQVCEELSSISQEGSSS